MPYTNNDIADESKVFRVTSHALVCFFNKLPCGHFFKWLDRLESQAHVNHCAWDFLFVARLFCVRVKHEAMAAAKTKTRKPVKRNAEARKDLAKSYNKFKEFEGQQYTGMKVGRSHKWYYDKGEWKEKKLTPDEWEINYAVTKRRAGKAPEGSGVPVGTEYHWYIMAHQHVRKLNANDYTTTLSGMKFKVAHKRSDTEKWSASDRAQKKRLIKIFQRMIDQLERELKAEE